MLGNRDGAKIVIDSDLQAVLEFMQDRIAATKLIQLADSLPQMARLLWGSCQQEHFVPIWLSPEKPSLQNQSPLGANGYSPARAYADDDSGVAAGAQ